MSLSSLFARSTRFLGHVGSQAAVSIVASAVAAAFLALPNAATTAGAGSEAAVARPEPQGWISPVAPDGKIRDRHHDAVGGEAQAQSLGGRNLVMPAMAAMPMSVGWTQAGIELPASRTISTASADVHPRVAQLQAARKATPTNERPRLLAEAAPLSISPAVQMVEAAPLPEAADQAVRPPATVLGRAVPEPVSRVGDVMSSAVGLVGAAGSWTVSRASSLLPRL